MAGLITLKCPTCGARLQFNKSSRVLTCEHCGNAHLLDSGSTVLAASYQLPKRDWIRVGEYEIYLHEILEDQISDQRVIYINVEYANERSKEALSCRINQWLLFDQENYSYEPARSNQTLYEDQDRPFIGSERFANPKMHVRGWIAFKVPPSAQLKRLQFFTGFLSTKSVDIVLDGLQLA